MTRDFEIVKEKVATTYIGNDGNLDFHTRNERFFLTNEDDETISHQYYCMDFLGDDHFAVCDIRNNVSFASGCDYSNIIQGEYEIGTPKMKWGVIRVTRDEAGKIIPGAEVMVIPCIYDRISEGNLKTAIVKNEKNLTYLDLDVDSSSYGEQLVPCVLSHAVPFATEYEGFAECSVRDEVGYLPRNCKARASIGPDELLTKTQVVNLSKYLNDSEDYPLDSATISSYFNLTRERLVQERGTQKKKVR